MYLDIILIITNRRKERKVNLVISSLDQ